MVSGDSEIRYLRKGGAVKDRWNNLYSEVATLYEFCFNPSILEIPESSKYLLASVIVLLAFARYHNIYMYKLIQDHAMILNMKCSVTHQQIEDFYNTTYANGIA